MSRPSVYLSALGCRLNEAELLSWRRALSRAGHPLSPAANEADLIVLNTCAVTQEAVRKSKRQLRWLRRQAPDAKVVLTGCFATLEPDTAAALAGVDAVVPNTDKDALVPRIRALLGDDSAPAAHTEPEATGLVRTHTRAFVKVQDGCRNRCTFCIVTVARGQERSRSIADVLDEVRALVEVGYQEIVLTGVHLGGYGSDTGETLASLVRAVLDEVGVERLRLGSLEPWDLPDGFFSLWSDPRLCPHLHLPLQSGCDATLKRMARRCPTARYRDLIARARAEIPRFNVTTDLIVGFPGETDAEFAQTEAFVREIGFGHLHVFSYSRREGTGAARMPGAVPKAVKRARAERMRALAREQTRAALLRAVGEQRAVLWDKREGEVPGGVRWSGYTPEYLRVAATAPAGAWLRNTVEAVQLDRVGEAGCLEGLRLGGV